jgi:hypothetical protein
VRKLETSVRAQREFKKLEPLIRRLKYKTSFHLQNPNHTTNKKRKSEPCHRKTQAASMKPTAGNENPLERGTTVPRARAGRAIPQRNYEQGTKINLLSEQPCRVLEQVEPFRRGITSRERKSLLPADDTRNGKTERATVLFSRAAEDHIGAVQNPGARAHVAKKNQMADPKSKLESGRPARTDGKHEESRAVATGQGSVGEQRMGANAKT